MLMSNYISLVYYTPVKIAFDKNKVRSIFKHRSIERIARVNQQFPSGIKSVGSKIWSSGSVEALEWIFNLGGFT